MKKKSDDRDFPRRAYVPPALEKIRVETDRASLRDQYSATPVSCSRHVHNDYATCA